MEPAAFDAERPRLMAIAMRILGSESEADDVLQEAWFRLSGTDGVDDLPAWLTTVVTRLCVDQLRKRRTRASFEATANHTPALIDPEADVVLAEKTGEAMAIVLESLAPAERVAFVLHDVFGYSFSEISAIMGRSETAVRKLASRARRKVQGQPEPFAAKDTRERNRQVVTAFLTAARGGDLATLLSLLAPDVVMRADMVGQSMGTEPSYEGPTAVAARFNGSKGALPALIDSELGAAWIHDGSPKVAFIFHLNEESLVQEVELIADPEVLATLDIERLRRNQARQADVETVNNTSQDQ